MSPIKYILKIVRNGLGLLIVFADRMSRPQKLIRSNQAQEMAQDSVNNLSLYQFYACPFCIKTRRAIHKLNVNIKTHDINKNPVHREQLQTEGGKVKVPCLRIEEAGKVRWLYESDEIIRFLQLQVA